MKSSMKWTDPFDDMSDEELDRHVDALFSERTKSIGVSLRIPQPLLQRVKREAARAGMPYQTFIKAMIEAAVVRLERRPAATRARRRRSA